MNEKAFRDYNHPWIDKQRFVDVGTEELLRLSPSLASTDFAGAPPAWVFDLDSTLFCTAPRNKRVLWRFLRQREDFPQAWIRAWSALTPSIQRYGIAQTFYYVFREQGLPQEEAQLEAKSLWNAFRDFWTVEFFLSRNIVFDTPYDGALEFVRSIYERGYHVVYLTGRDSDRAQAGSHEVLRRCGFPMGERTHLWLKPSREQDDLEFKAIAAAKLKAQFSVRALIDNEPENVVMFAEKFPEAEVIFYHSIMSPREPSRSFAKALGERKAWRLVAF
ncbi:MAG: HAD family hydrolase [Bdellovibrionota bacterium]